VTRRVAGFELLVPIGAGGMGAVHLARRNVVGDVSRLYALKLVHPQAEPGTRADDLLEEARVCAHVQHPNVVQIVEAGQSEDGVYLAMEYVEGCTVRDLLSYVQSKDLLPFPVVGRIMSDALRGLAAAHRACDDRGQPLQIVHRDFSPQNLLVGCDGVTRLADFGIARAASRQGVTRTGLVKGKLHYMAPEQAHGASLDARCDLWAAGVVLWEMLTGQRMLAGSGDAQILLELISGPEPDPPSLYRRVSRDVDDLLAAMLQRDLEHRIASADEALRQLHEAWEPDLAEPEAVAAVVSEAVGGTLADRRRDLDTATRTLTAVTATTDARRRPIVPVAMGAFLAAGALAGLTLSQLDVTTAARLEPFVLDLQVPPAPATSTTTAPSVPTTIAIRADAMVVQIRIENRAPLVLPEPSRELQLPASARGKEVTLFARDGRHSTVRVAGPTKVVFPKSPAPRRLVPRPVPNDDRLAPEP